MVCDAVAAAGGKALQLLHDGGTLKSGEKFQVIAVQFVAKDWSSNEVVCISFKRQDSGTASDVAATIKKEVEDLLGGSLDDAVTAVVQDAAAESTSRMLNVANIQTCHMHAADKVGMSAVGNLVRRRNRQPVNAFPGGQKLLKMAHQTCKHFW